MRCCCSNSPPSPLISELDDSSSLSGQSNLSYIEKYSASKLVSKIVMLHEVVMKAEFQLFLEMNSILPRKSSAEKWSASHTCSSNLAGILHSVSSHEKSDSFLDMTIFSSAGK